MFRGTLICVQRNSLDRVSGVLFLLVYTASIASDKRRIQTTHKPNLFHTSRFCKLSGKLLNSDRERYFFHVYERCRSYAEVECGWKKKKITPPVPQFEAKVVSCLLLDIATVKPLLFYETGSKCTGGYYGCKLLWVFNDKRLIIQIKKVGKCCLLYTSDAADE